MSGPLSPRSGRADAPAAAGRLLEVAKLGLASAPVPDPREPTSPGSAAPLQQLRCAEEARRASLEPVASAPSVAGVVLVEHPLPWPRDAGDVAELAPVTQALRELAARGEQHRLQLVTPAAPGRGGQHRHVVWYRRPPGPFAGLDGVELVVPAAQVAEAAAALLRDPGTTSRTPTAATDVLVCTHGSRDLCCGSMGTDLVRRLGGLPARLWRTSHLGGHRFAPTCVVLPAGHMWAYLDESVVRDVVAARLPRDGIRRHFRGMLGVEDGALQVAEREAFCALGWRWTAARRHVEERIEVAPGTWRVRLRFEDERGGAGAVTAQVRHDGDIEVLACRGIGEPTRSARWLVEVVDVAPAT